LNAMSSNLPAVVKTWQYQADQVIAGNGTALTQAQNLLYAVINTMLGTGTWKNGADGTISVANAATVVGSSDGSTSNMAGTNLITAANKLVWATAGTAHSWIVFNFAQIGIHVLIDCNFSSGSADSITVKTSQVGFGAAHGGTDGSTTAAPTATDSVSVLAGTWGGTVTINTQTAYNAMLSADGKILRIFFFRNSHLCGMFDFGVPDSPDPLWTNPYVAWAVGSGTPAPSSDVPTFANLYGTAPVGAARINGVNSVVGYGVFAQRGNSSSLFEVWTAVNTSFGAPYWGLPYISNTVGAVGQWGKAIDIGVTLSNKATGSTAPLAGGNTFAVFGGLVVPWKTTVPVIA